MTAQRTLIRNGCVLTLDRAIGNFRTADVLIEGARIDAVGPNLSVDGAQEIDAANMIVMPVNDPIGAVVWGMDTSNVDTVMIAGKLMKRHGELLNVDLQRARRLATESRDYVVAQSGFKLPEI